MKQLVKVTIIAGFTLTLSAGALFGQVTNPVVSIDEFGVGTLNGNPLPFSLGPDPSGGVTTSPVLIYTLPFPVLPGDIVLTATNEPPNSPTWPMSDVVRFWNSTSANQGQIIFYSDASPIDPPNAPADSGLPSQLLTPTIFINEIGPETGPNGATYLAAPGTPGGVPGLATSIQYNILSDPVPEPGTATLLFAGAGILFGINRCRTKKS